MPELVAVLIIAGLIASNVALWATRNSKASEVETKVVRLREVVTTGEFANLNLNDRIAELEIAVGGLDQLSANALDLTSERIDELAICVNSYMDTVAQAQGGPYQYFYC